METDSLPKMSSNFKELRNMWSSKVQSQAKPLQPTSIPSNPPPEKQQEQKLSPRNSIPVLKITNDIPTISSTKKESSTNERPTIFEAVEKLPSIEENVFFHIPPPPPTIVFQHQARSVATLKNTVNKMGTDQKKKILSKDPRITGIHRWNVTRHVFRSGLIFNRVRRASDSILPLLMRTHKANHHRRDSIDSTLSETPFQNLIDYLTFNENNDKDLLTIPNKIKRSASDTSDCIRRNKLDDSIFQYEMILRHLKNYEQFMTKHPGPSTTTSSSISKKQQSFDTEANNSLNETEEKFLTRTSIPNRQTQSLSRNVGRTFAEFIMNDLFLSPTPKSPSKEQRDLNISHASSQTDITEPIPEIREQINDRPPSLDLCPASSISNEEAKAVLNELDTILDINNQELLTAIDNAPITPNSEINVIVLNSPELSTDKETLPTEKPLMQRLFEGKKTAYTPADLDMKSLRLTEEMAVTYETAKKKCFFDTEEVVYASNMIKVSRRGYTQHVRLLCITTERLYNLTKRDPYPKEGLLFYDILGITCTPYKDGFVCVHTRETHEDRGDWLIIVDHPCEFITQLFTMLGRDDNDDDFLKFETKFKHCRRCYGEGSSNDCIVEARLADSFRIKKADFDCVIVYTT